MTGPHVTQAMMIAALNQILRECGYQPVGPPPVPPPVPPSAAPAVNSSPSLATSAPAICRNETDNLRVARRRSLRQNDKPVWCWLNGGNAAHHVIPDRQ